MTDANRPLWQWSACDLAEAIAARKATAVEAVGAAVARMRATNGTWNRDEHGAEGVREVLGSALYSYAMNFMGLPAAIVPANENGVSRLACRSSAVASAKT
jgi:hypothetical protein